MASCEEAQANQVSWMGQGLRETPSWRMLTRLTESVDLASICAELAGWKENSTKKQWLLSTFLSPKGVAPTPAPPAFDLNLVTFVPLHMLLVLFMLLFLCWNSE